MIITMIAMVDANRAISSNGIQPYYFSEDMRHFISLTLHKTVIYGRKTLETFPNGKPLARRQNIILTRNPNIQISPENHNCIANSVEDALRKVSSRDSHVYVIGGAEIYEQFEPRADIIELTRVVDTFPEPCKYFPQLDNTWEFRECTEWMTSISKPKLRYRFETYYHNNVFPTIRIAGDIV